MFRPRCAQPSRGEQHETPLHALQKDVQRRGLQDILSSLPAPDSFHFNKARKNGYETITLFLGNRPNPNGSTSQAWARIVSFSERKDFQPPLLFYEQEFDGRGTRQYPRSASSLLRKATQLLPPFCFFQHDPIDEATNVREMLSAIILYLAAAADVDASASQWDKFGDSLVQALRYIDSRGAFHEWRHQQKLAALSESNIAKATAAAQQEPGSESTVDQPSDPVPEQPRTSSAIQHGQYLGGIVRSRGSDIAIKPNTCLAKLKRELGDRKFKMLDKIPPKPMTISRHSIGGSLFPFRMFVGTASYQETGEIIDVYAYIDHEDGKASMYFMSHDKAELEQMYDVNDMRDGVDLVQPLEYLNNLKKASYKDDAKSARTAKLRSLISYYFFVAENKGLIGNPGIEVNGGFCKRLCAVCKELGEEKWDDEDDGGSDGDQGNPHDTTEFDRPGRNPAQDAHESTRVDTELLTEAINNVKPSRTVAPRMRTGGRSDAGRNQSKEPDKDAPDRDSLTDQAPSVSAEGTATLELELRPPSQVAHEDLTAPSENHADLMSIDDGPSDNEPVGATSSDEQRMRSRSPQTEAVLSVNEEETPIALLKHLVMTANKAADAVMARNDRTVPNAYTKTQQDSRSFDDTVALRSLGGPINDAAEHVPMDVYRPAQTPSRSRASSVASSKAKPTLIFNTPLLSRSVPNLLAAQIGGNRPPTPEGSAERDLKSQGAPSETRPAVPQAPLGLEAILISDDEDEILALPGPRSATKPTPAVRNGIREDVVDLTQLSSSPGDKKRKLLGTFYLSDSENDVIAETDGSEWRRKSGGRRK